MGALTECLLTAAAAWVALLGLGLGVADVNARLLNRGGGGARTRLIPKYHGIRHCDNKTSGMRLFNVTQHMDEDGYEYVDAELEMLKPINTIKALTLVIHRCTDGLGPNQCEYFNRWSWSAALCSLAVAKGMVWSPSIDSISPPFKCPVSAGLKHVRNASLDARVLEQYAARSPIEWEKHSWPFEFQLFNEEDKLTFCVQGVGEYRRVIVKKETIG
ncbi:Aspartate carbamoyltransferase [Frankliniella fusca]|uniref:Aspartate carbamoyltransferase n=1 Tax=Frankliniella fusca TaxID=407009 RepID=A0AAE1LDJ4_9NEOP|nr:Aspartate carbamoyltransferase [Frankliniella fusca]